MAAAPATSSSAVSIPSLPSEIVLQILEAGYFNHKFRPDRYYLNSCSQVCRSWASQAQPLLFRHVEVRRPSSFAGLLETLTLSTHRRKAMRETVLWLRIWVGFSDSVSRPEALSSLLAICPNLYGLSVTFRDMWTLPYKPLILPPNILALECCDWERNLGIAVARILIRSGWHSLRILVLRGHAPLDQISPHLVELKVVESGSDFITDAWVSGRPPVNLRILEATLGSRSFVELSQHSLESIQLAWCRFPSALNHCTRLREFKVETPISQKLFLALRRLPLEHLAFVIVPTWSLDDCSREYVSLSKALRVVSCLTSIRPLDLEMTKYIDDLEKICHKKQVRLDHYTNLISFRALMV